MALKSPWWWNAWLAAPWYRKIWLAIQGGIGIVLGALLIGAIMYFSDSPKEDGEDSK